MNKIVSKFAFVLRSRRKERRMTQKALGQLTRLSSKLISKFENGDQIPNKLQRTSLEDVLGRLPTPTRFRPPRHNNAWRELFKDKRSWKRHRDRSFTSRLKTARIHYAHEIRKLKPAIDDHEPWMEASDSGSCLELVTCSAIFAIEGAVELSVRPISWGFRKLAVCDQVTGEIMADKCFPAIGLAWDACHAVLIPQVPLPPRTGRSSWTSWFASAWEAPASGLRSRSTAPATPPKPTNCGPLICRQSG